MVGQPVHQGEPAHQVDFGAGRVEDAGLSPQVLLAFVGNVDQALVHHSQHLGVHGHFLVKATAFHHGKVVALKEAGEGAVGPLFKEQLQLVIGKRMAKVAVQVGTSVEAAVQVGCLSKGGDQPVGEAGKKVGAVLPAVVKGLEEEDGEPFGVKGIRTLPGLAVGPPEVPHPVPVGPAFGAQKPPLAGDEVQEHDAVEKLMGIIPGPGRPIVRVLLRQVLPDAMEGLAIIPEELLGDPVDAEGVPMKGKDLLGVLQTVGSDPPDHLQVGAVRRVGAHREPAQIEAHPSRVAGVGKAQGRDEEQFLERLMPEGKDEEVLALRVVAIERFQEAADVRPPDSFPAHQDVEYPQRRPISQMHNLVGLKGGLPGALGQVADVPGDRLFCRITEFPEKVPSAGQVAVLLQGFGKDGLRLFRVSFAHPFISCISATRVSSRLPLGIRARHGEIVITREGLPPPSAKPIAPLIIAQSRPAANGRCSPGDHPEVPQPAAGKGRTGARFPVRPGVRTAGPTSAPSP